MPDEPPDPIAILATLGVTDATAATPVSGGMDTAIWRVEAGGQTYALRVFRPDQANGCRREAAAMRAAGAAGLPVPILHAEGVWQDRPAMLLGWLPGRTLTAEFFARPWLAPSPRPKLFAIFVTSPIELRR